MPQFFLRTLLILLAAGPMLLAALSCTQRRSKYVRRGIESCLRLATRGVERVPKCPQEKRLAEML